MRLREFTIQDASRVASLVGDKSVSSWTSRIPFPYSEKDAIEWIRNRASNSDHRPFAVEVAGELVACVSFWPHGEGEVEVGYWVGKDFWGKGICTQALNMLMSDERFPKGAKVVAKVMKGNFGSERVLEKCGFKYLRDCTLQKMGEEVSGKFYVLAPAT